MKLRNNLICFVLVLFSLKMQAQLAAGSTSPDFTGVDLNGQSHTLYNYLNAGKVVVLDFSATWCGPCWNYHNSGAMKTFYNNRGPNSANYQANVFFIESECNNSTGCLYGSGGGGTPFQSCTGSSTQGNWVASTPYPIIDNCTIKSSFAVGYFPTVYMVCPNKNIYEVGSASAASLDANMLSKCGITPGTTSAPLAYTVTSQTNTTCATNSNGSITIAPTGGQTPYTYNWSNGAKTATINNLSAGAYYCTITAANNSTLVSNQIAIFNGPAITANASVVNNQACGTVGAINLTASGGNSALTYTWNTGATSQNLSNVTATGNYSVTVSDNKGCTQTVQNLALTAYNNQPTANAGQPQTVSCTNTQATLNGTASPSNANYTYQWSVVSGAGQITSGATSLTAKVNGAGTFKLIVTDPASACVANSTVSVASNVAPPSAAITSNGNLTCTNQIVLLQTILCPTCNVAWSGGTLTGNTTTVNVSAAGNYQAIVTNTANGCSATATQNITANTVLPIITTATPQSLTCSLTSTNLTVTGNAQNTYLWTATNGGLISAGSTGTTPTVNAAGTYSVVATDPTNGCTASQSVNVVQNGNVPQANLTAAGYISCSNPTVGLTATVPTGNQITYNWTAPNGQTLSGLTPNVNSAGTYSLVVSDGSNGCSVTKTVNVTADLIAPDVDLETPELITCSKSSVSVAVSNPNSAYNYTWTLGATAIASAPNTNVTAAGSYILTVKNPINGCVATKNIDVKEDKIKPTIGVLGTAFELYCKKTSIAFAPVVTTVTNPTFAWSATNAANIIANPTTASASVTTAGTYSLLVTNPDNGCSATKSVDVTSVELPKPAVAVKKLNCFKDCDASINATIASGGKAPFTYKWSNGTSGPENSKLCASEYNLVTTDALGCESSLKTTIVEPTEVVLTSKKQDANDVINSGKAEVSVLGGTPPYQYKWSNGATTSKIVQLTAGKYTVEVTDANGCKKSIVVEIFTILADNDIKGLELLQITPNPTQDNVDLTLRLQQSATIQVQLYNTNGQLIMSREKQIGTQIKECFDLTNYPTGVYLLHININNQTITKRVVKS